MTSTVPAELMRVDYLWGSVREVEAPALPLTVR